MPQSMPLRLVALLLPLTVCAWPATAAERPHIVLIMVDDLGFSDLGYHGGEIRTPHLDSLAAGGVRFSQFYNSGRCCPTRASLMTGLHPHQTGIGHMTNPPGQTNHDLGVDGYRGFLNDACVTLAEVLRSAGYATMMTGKWHLGFERRGCWPLQRGFDRYYGCIPGATRFFHPVQPRGMVLDNDPLGEPESTTDRPFYTTDAFTDYAIRFIGDHLDGDRKENPFFLYLAYTAPHWPLQAFEDDVAKYRGRYRQGWERLRRDRHRRQVELGLVDPRWPLSPPTPGIPEWESLDEEKRDEMDLKMAVYAAMVDRVDQNIGKLVDQLKRQGVFDDTLILFLSDNGACQEGGMLGRGEFYDVEKRNREHNNSYGEAWANAGSTPFRLYKHFLHEGGSATPFFMHWPARVAPREDWYDSPAQLIDIMPTLADLAGAEYPRRFRDHDIPPAEGITLRPALDGEPLTRDRPIFMEHENNASIRDGDWKLVGRAVAGRDGVDPTQWELYNLRDDRTELNDLAEQMPDKTRSLARQWNRWAERVGVYPKGESTAPAPQPQPVTPQVAGRPLTITARVRDPRPHGVVLAQGGLRFGYSLHFVNGRPAFSIRDQGKLTELVAEDAVRGGVDVRAELTAETMSIAVDGQIVAQTPSPGLLSGQPVIGLYVGVDRGDPVGDYPRLNRFNGRVVSHQVVAEGADERVTMRTRWGEELESNAAKIPWTEYPRPAMVRDRWLNLNGPWDYAVTAADAEGPPDSWDGTIRVPFPLESPLSGVERRLSPDEALWYRRTFDLEKRPGKRQRINFEAVDYEATLWINATRVGTHVGGNLPFSFDITEALRDGRNTITLRVTDATDTAYQLHGKQRLEPQGIWYTPVSGIWQTVWLEQVPERSIESFRMTTSLAGRVEIVLRLQGGDAAGPPTERAGPTTARAGPTTVRAVASLDGRVVARGEGPPHQLVLIIPDPQLWSPESPTLYDLEITAGEDTVRSYVGIRESSRRRDADGHWRLTLNGRESFQFGTLDQGWWPDGLLTPPSDEAMVSDIEFLKAAGFNTIRKHIKVEPRRYYYHCDRLGMLLWQDHVSAMADNPPWTRLQPDPEDPVWPEEPHRQFMAELEGMVDSLYNHPSIVQWVPFNEAWGQHQTIEVGRRLVEYDPTRLVNVASGGNFLPVGHVVDHHQYPHPGFPFELGQNGRFDDFVKVVGEFGGHGYPVEGHLWSTRTRNWGYGGLPENREEWIERYKESIRLLAELRQQGIAAGIYTQTSDVEGEINGLLTYDRRVQKLAPEELREIHVAAGLASDDRPAADNERPAAEDDTAARHGPGGEPRLPNIVVFLSDDHTWRDSSVYGSPDIDTPQMARLAAAGMTLDNAYVVSPSCAPSRAALLTGLYPARNGAEPNHSRPRAELKKLPAYLQQLGYEVVSFGKVGHYRQTPEYGFDLARHFGYHEDEAVPEALRWLRDRRSDRPLCLFVGTNWPHVPWPEEIDGIDPEQLVVPPNHVDHPLVRLARARYVAAVRIMDRELGQVYDLARELLGPDTFFLHSSDHGAQWPFGKWNLYDDGIRTPMIASWPGRIAPGSRSRAMVSWIDILPTLVEVAGGPPPGDIDGRSFLDVLQGRADEHRDLVFTTHSGDGSNNVYPIRAASTPDGWKYIRNLHPDFRFTTHITTQPDRHPYWQGWLERAEQDEGARRKVTAYQQRPGEELYFLPDDPYEQNNLVDDPAHQDRLRSLRTALDDWLDETDDTLEVFGEPKPLDGQARRADPPATDDRPNVLLVLVDDLKPTLGCYGDPLAHTPNIDRLAARAMRFDLAYCNQAVCAPSRFNLMLGSHSTSTGLYGLASQIRDVIPDAVTLPQHFARHGGYRTESIGKVFHVGHGNRGDPGSFSTEPYEDKVIEYAYPRGGKLGRAIRNRRFRLVQWEGGDNEVQSELYDYRQDPLERVNLAARRPAVVRRLQGILDRYPEPIPHGPRDGAPRGRQPSTSSSRLP